MAFDIKQFLNTESKKEMGEDFVVKKIPADKLHPSVKNFYSIDPAEVEALKETIELVGVQENLVVAEAETPGEYDIISGHKRHKAVTELLEEGKAVSNLLPCKVESAADGVKNELILIFTNSTQRERSDFCKMQEIQRVKELLEEYAKENNLPGRKRDIIAAILNTSKTKIGRLDNINHNLIPEFMEEYKAGHISTHAANEISGATEEAQQQLWQQYKETGTIYGKDAKAAKEDPAAVPETDAQRGAESAEKHAGEEIPAETPQTAAGGTEDAREREETEQVAGEAAGEETKVTIKRQTDTTDRESLIISGEMNPNKEYNGMNIKYFADAITNSDLFDNDFWRGWIDPAQDKAALITDYAGVLTAYTADTGEPCRINITDCVTVERVEAQATGKICFKEFAEIVDALIFTKVIQIETEAVDIPYWIKNTAREIAGLAIWATEEDLSVLQEIALRMKERANK